jgi:D-sedoheptulose 7-phosphate isomerase
VSIFIESLEAHLSAAAAIRNLSDQVQKAGDLIIDAFKNNHKALFFGNGGSAADSQHIAAELVGRYKMERKGMPAIALTTDTSVLTAVGNDYSIDRIFSRQIEALANKGDVAIGFSTSGKSRNVLEALVKARETGCGTVAFLGGSGGDIKNIVDLPIIVSSNDTPRIQECHILIGHIICEIVEMALAEK